MIVGRAITIEQWRKEAKNHTDTKNEAKRLGVTIFAIAKLEEGMGSNIEKSNILVEHKKLFCILGAPIIFSLTVHYELRPK